MLAPVRREAPQRRAGSSWIGRAASAISRRSVRSRNPQDAAAPWGATRRSGERAYSIPTCVAGRAGAFQQQAPLLSPPPALALFTRRPAGPAQPWDFSRTNSPPLHDHPAPPYLMTSSGFRSVKASGVRGALAPLEPEARLLHSREAKVL